MIPTLEALEACLESARHSANGLAAREIRVGGPADLERTIGDLLATNTRLIIANRVHFPDAWERGDSYSAFGVVPSRACTTDLNPAGHEAYDTDDPAKVKAALEATHEDATRRAAKGEGPRATIYQLQATPTADIVRRSLSQQASVPDFPRFPVGRRRRFSHLLGCFELVGLFESEAVRLPRHPVSLADLELSQGSRHIRLDRFQNVCRAWQRRLPQCVRSSLASFLLR